MYIDILKITHDLVAHHQTDYCVKSNEELFIMH